MSWFNNSALSPTSPQTDVCAGKKEHWSIRWFIDLLMNSDNLRTSRLCAFVANKCSAFQAGFWRRFMPQNKFCGYENSAFQAKNTFEYRNPSQWKPSIHRLTFAWKAITFITAGHRPADKDVPTITAWKAELLPLYKWISTPAKKNTDRLDDLLIYWWIPDDAGGIIFFHFQLLHFSYIIHYYLSIVNYMFISL
jgi:hypothetical protein